LRGVVNCHCGMCLKWHGHFGAYTAAEERALAIGPGDTLTWYRSSDQARRGFCRSCGSCLFWQRDGGATLSIAAGTLDQPSGLATVAHIFTERLADYYVLSDSLKRLPRGLSQG
jgi:hypothetical protein